MKKLTIHQQYDELQDAIRDIAARLDMAERYLADFHRFGWTDRLAEAVREMGEAQWTAEDAMKTCGIAA